MKLTGDQHMIKRINKAIVLDIIKQDAPISRAEISVKSGLNKATVSSLVSELIDEQLVYETGLGESSGGRKPIMLLFNEKAGYAIGIDLGIDYLLTVVTDLAGQVVKQYETPIKEKAPDSIISQIVEIYELTARSLPESPYGLIGLGIGAPGIVDSEGTILSAPHLRWKKVALQKQLSEAIAEPVLVDNEANTGALGESQFGIGKQSSNLIFISIGRGIGTGIILNGQLYRGVTGFSGEMGHMTIRENGEPCPCGNQGCWELYASESALLDHASTFWPNERVTVPVLLDKAKRHDAQAIDCFERFGHDLGIGLVNIVNTFNPEKIIIGKQIAAAEQWIHPSLKQVVKSRSLSSHYNDVNIEYSALGNRASAIGAASLAVQHFFKQTT